jgi:hypothetical protein
LDEPTGESPGLQEALRQHEQEHEQVGLREADKLTEQRD